MNVYVTVFLCVPQGRSGCPLTERPSHHSASRIHHRSCAEVSALTQVACLYELTVLWVLVSNICSLTAENEMEMNPLETALGREAILV